MWYTTNAYKMQVEIMKERGHFGDLVIDGRIILVYILEKCNSKVYTKLA
jgi:hypothetical protein